MRIDYNKRINNEDELKPFLAYLNAINNYNEKFIVPIHYDLRGLERKLVGDMKDSLDKNGFKTVPSGNGSLWVSEPDQFSLKVIAKIPGKRPKHTERSISSLEDDEVQKYGTKETKSFLTKLFLKYLS